MMYLHFYRGGKVAWQIFSLMPAEIESNKLHIILSIYFYLIMLKHSIVLPKYSNGEIVWRLHFSFLVSFWMLLNFNNAKKNGENIDR